MQQLPTSYRPDDFAPLARMSTVGFCSVLRISRGRPMHVENRYPAHWRDRYERRSYFLRDPAVAWALAQDGTADWNELEPGDAAGVVSDARAHGLSFGMIAATGTEEMRSFCCLARHDRPFGAAERRAALRAIEDLHEGPPGVAPLTPAQREALRLMARGERHQRAAALIGIGESALKARLRAARRSLGARTTAEAVHAAQTRGEI